MKVPPSDYIGRFDGVEYAVSDLGAMTGAAMCPGYQFFDGSGRGQEDASVDDDNAYSTSIIGTGLL